MVEPNVFVKEGEEHKVCKLQKTVYGLKQAARVWNKETEGTLVELGFKQSISVFIYEACR